MATPAEKIETNRAEEGVKADQKVAADTKTPEQVLEKFVNLEFPKAEKEALYGYTPLRHNVAQTVHYKGEFPVPRVTLFHPYNPNSNQYPEAYSGIPATVLAAKCPEETAQFLPEHIKKALAESKVEPQNVECYFSTQNLPWLPLEGTLLIRPHYWVHGSYDETPELESDTDILVKAGVFNETTPCHVGVFPHQEVNITCDNVKNKMLPKPIPVHSHAEDNVNPGSMVVCSPDDKGIIQGIDFITSESLYSVVVTPEGKACVVLHWILNFNDQEAITKISPQIKNLRDFILAVHKLPNSKLNAENGPLHDLMALLNVHKSIFAPTPKLEAEDWELSLALANLVAEEQNKQKRDKLRGELKIQLDSFENLKKYYNDLTDSFTTLSQMLERIDEDDNALYALDKGEFCLKQVKIFQDHLFQLEMIIKEGVEKVELDHFQKLIETGRQLASKQAFDKAKELAEQVKREHDYFKPIMANLIKLQAKQNAQNDDNRNFAAR